MNPGREIKFDKSLYSLKAVRAAEEAYRDWADFRVTDGQKTIKVAVRNVADGAADELIPEFCNYVLGVTAAAAI